MSGSGRQSIARKARRGAWIVPLLLLLTAGFALLSPPDRSGPSDLVILRSMEILGQTGPGQGAPTVPGWANGGGLALAATLRAAHVVAGGGVPLAEFLQADDDRARAFLRWLAASLAAALVLLTWRVLRRAIPSAASGEDGKGASGRAVAAAALFTFGILLIAPLLAIAVSRASPVLGGSCLLLLLTERLHRAGDPEGWRWGLVSGFLNGLLLAMAAWLWPVVAVFLTAGLVQRRGARPLLVVLVVAVALALALDPARLSDPRSVLPALGTEWARAGGWNLSPVPFGSESAAAVLSLAPLTGWGLLPIFACAAFFALRDRRADLLVWWGGLCLVLLVLPVASGVRDVDWAQQALGAVWIAAGGGAAARIFTARPAVGVVVVIAALVLAGWARLGWSARDARPDGSIPVEQIAAAIPEDALLLAERALPSLGHAPARTFVLPRDSRRPERYDFVYWPRWYSAFTHILLFEGAARQNAERPGPRHFYGQLVASAQALGRWGPEGEGIVLYGIASGSPWSRPLAPEELEKLGASPDLLPFLGELGSVHASAGRLDVARFLFEAGIGLDPTREPLYNNLGSVYLLEEEWEEAARVFDKGLALDARSPQLCYNAARAYFELGAYGRAEQLLRRAVGLRPDFADAHYELGRTFLALGQRELARIALERVLTLDISASRRRAVEEALRQLQGEASP